MNAAAKAYPLEEVERVIHELRVDVHRLDYRSFLVMINLHLPGITFGQVKAALREIIRRERGQ